MRVGNYEFANKELGRLYQKCLEAEERGKRSAREETARKLLARGWDAAEVAELTDLDLEDVRRLAH